MKYLQSYMKFLLEYKSQQQYDDIVNTVIDRFGKKIPLIFYTY